MRTRTRSRRCCGERRWAGVIKRIARELGCSYMTVRRYVAEGGYVLYRRPLGRPRALAGHDRKPYRERFAKLKAFLRKAAERTVALGHHWPASTPSPRPNAPITSPPQTTMRRDRIPL